jgi:hypothetical protein
MISRPLIVYWANASIGTIFQGLRSVPDMILPRTSAVKPVVCWVSLSQLLLESVRPAYLHWKTTSLLVMPW